MKTCVKCGLSLPHSYFHRNKYSPDGMKSECKKCSAGRVKEWKRANKDRVNEQNREYLRAKREQALLALGGKCASCGNADKRVLQIDHVNGGGNSDRKGSRVSVLNRVISGESGFQSLCANCHCIKSFENGEYGNVVSV